MCDPVASKACYAAQKPEALWHAGYFSDLATEVTGPWLRVMLTIGATVCLVGLYSSTIITCETSMLFFFQTYFPGFTNDSAMAEAGPYRRWLFERTAAGTLRDEP